MTASAPHHRPLFTSRTVAGCFPAMLDAAGRLVRRRQRRPEGREVDVSLEMTRVTLDVLERTIFTRHFEGMGRIGPVDIFGLPHAISRRSFSQRQFRNGAGPERSGGAFIGAGHEVGSCTESR